MARFTGGWFKAWRDFWVEDLSQNIFLWGLWNALLYMATYKETKIIWEGKPRVLPPGSVVFGIKELAEKWDCSRTAVKRWLDYLVVSERISLETSHRGCIVTIRDWEDFQNAEQEARQQRDINGATTVQQRDNNETLSKESKKERKEEYKNNVGQPLNADCLPVGTNEPTLPTVDSSVTIPAPKRSKFTDQTRAKMRSFLETYARVYRAKYHGPPEGIRDKAVIGKLGHWIEGVSEARALALIEIYLQVDHKPINDCFHDLWGFFRHLNRIGVALETGSDSAPIDWAKVFGRSA